MGFVTDAGGKRQCDAYDGRGRHGCVRAGGVNVGVALGLIVGVALGVLVGVTLGVIVGVALGVLVGVTVKAAD